MSRFIKMINANDAVAECFGISINGGKETNKIKMLELPADLIKMLDPSIDNDKITINDNIS